MTTRARGFQPMSRERRDVLRQATAGVVALAVTGCGGGSSETAQTGAGGSAKPPAAAPGASPSPAPAPGSPPAPAPASTPAPAPGASPAPAPGPALTISGVRVEGLSASGASISWQTSRTATAEVEFGPTAAYGQRATGGAGVSHAVALSGLQPGTTYHYRVINREGTAMTVGPTGSFTTTGSLPTGRVTLAWDGATQNADSAGTPLTDLVGYRLYMSTTSGSYPTVPVQQIPATSVGGTLQATVSALAKNTYFFVVTAIDAYGNESARSEELPVVIQ